MRAVELARRLAMEFGAYVVRTHALRRVFVSIKGFYYQVRAASVCKGEWAAEVRLVPELHRSQKLPLPVVCMTRISF